MKTSSADNTQHPEAGSGRTRDSRAHSLRFGAAAVLVLLGTFAGLTVAGVTPAGATTIDATATLAQPGSLARLGSGGSATNFTVTLPKVGTAPAKCSGNTVSGGYHVYSYLLHVGVKPTTVTYKTGLPSTGSGSSPVPARTTGRSIPPTPVRSSVSPTTWISRQFSREV